MKILCTAFFLFASAFSAYASDLLQQKIPLIKVMPEMDVEWVAEQILYNGIPMSIQNFKTTKPAMEVIEYYKDQWENRVAEETVQQIKTIGTEIDGYYFSVQIQELGLGTQGTLTVTPSLNSHRVQASNNTEFPLIPDSLVISKIESMDRGVQSETLIAVNKDSVIDNENWLSIELVNQGWQRQENDTSISIQQNQPITYQRGKQLCQITLIGDDPRFQGSSMILVNWTKGD